jgi:hypothetical protein
MLLLFVCLKFEPFIAVYSSMIASYVCHYRAFKPGGQASTGVLAYPSG